MFPKGEKSRFRIPARGACVPKASRIAKDHGQDFYIRDSPF